MPADKQPERDTHVHRGSAEREYELYKEYNRPPAPYYMKCLHCREMWEIGDDITAADYDARRHAGVHGGLYDEHAEIVVTDSCGFEVFRVHSIFKPEQEPEGCPKCGAEQDRNRIACPDCGYIPEGDRLTAGGER